MGEEVLGRYRIHGRCWTKRFKTIMNKIGSLKISYQYLQLSIFNLRKSVFLQLGAKDVINIDWLIYLTILENLISSI